MKARQPAPLVEHVIYSKQIREFLQAFKVHPCPLQYLHHYQSCFYHHSLEDKRRNPYFQHILIYYPTPICNCERQVPLEVIKDCENSHNLFEEYYHPFKYKNTNCSTPNCQLGFYCGFIHPNQYQLLQKNHFFRFDLNTFKTQPCPQIFPGNHELSSCRFYHGESDRRRNPRKVTYSHVECQRLGCNDPLCPKTHNKIEQLYHPSRYKTKYCQNFFNRKSCSYHEFCSFAHSDQQIEIQLLHLMPETQQFKDYRYKTVWCPYTQSHDRSNCPYAHNFQDFRRNLKQFFYTPQTCEKWNRGKIESIEQAGCPLRLQCLKSHGWLQKKYHPDLKKWESGQSQSEADSGERIEAAVNGFKKRSCQLEDLGVGAPFFKTQERQERGKSQPRASAEREREAQRVRSQKVVILPLFYKVEEVWQPVVDDQKARNQKNSPPVKSKKVKRTSSKSMDISYSTSLKQLLLKVGLQDKVSPHRITQVNLVGLGEDEINKLDYLTINERQRLSLIICQYIKTHGLQSIQYSKSMVQFFKFKSRGSILQKMKGRKVNQRKLLDLSPSVIEDLSFLAQDEKQSLPVLLDNFVDDRAFRELNTLIINETREHPT